MTYITFSFDTEDYINEAAAEGILRCAEILRRNGVTGCFNVVAYLAEALEKWGRQDILDALKHHEIETHSLAHSWHPTINEYTDLEDFDEAKRLFLEKEGKALSVLSRCFGRENFPAACPPGESTSYVAHYGYAEMGIDFYDGDCVFDANRGRPVTCCNIDCLEYTRSLDAFLLEKTKEELLAYLDEMAEKKDYLILYHHPQKGYITEFCDILNLFGKNTPEENWVMSPLREEAERERFYGNFEFLVKAVKADPRFSIETYGSLRSRYPKQERVITRDMLPEIASQLEERFFPVTVPDSFCLSDMLLAARDFLRGEEQHVCKAVCGFLDTPYAVETPVTLCAADVKAAAGQIGDGFLPERITVGDAVIGPGDYLRAALRVLLGEDTVTVVPAPWQIDLDQFPRLRDLNYRHSWIHDRDWEDRYLSHRLRLQSWTIRLPGGTARMIF